MMGGWAHFLKSIPRDRACVIVVHNGRRREWLRREIAARLGNEIASHVTILIVASLAQVRQQLEGRRGPVFLDTAWSVMVRVDVAALAAGIVAQANALTTPIERGRVAT